MLAVRDGENGGKGGDDKHGRRWCGWHMVGGDDCMQGVGGDAAVL